MKLDTIFLITFLSIFVRLTSILLVAPITAHTVPVQVRIFLSAVCGLALAPVVAPFIHGVPDSMPDLIGLILRDVMFGLLIGTATQLVVAGFQMAGSLLDFQIGISSAQALNPTLGAMVGPVSQLKSMLATVLLLLLNGHQMMFRAFLESYAMPVGAVHMDQYMLGEVMTLIGRTMILAVQVAAPVSGVAVIIDIAAGVINKAVPQTQPFLIALPAKLGFGLLALTLGLPAMVIAVSRSLDFTFTAVHHLVGIH